MTYSYDRRKAATTTPSSSSVEGVARKWALELGNDILKAIPARYKADRKDVDQSRDYTEVRCKGTSVRDLDVEFVVGYMVDTFRGSTIGSIFWDEVGIRKLETEIKLRNDELGQKLVDLVRDVIERNERG